MAGEDLNADEKVRRGVARTLGNFVLLLAVLGLLGAWVATGFYRLEPQGGQAALILRLGEFQRTEARPGLRWHLPPPIERRQIVMMDELESEEFGGGAGIATESETRTETGDLVVQTKGNNIVNLSFAVQYKLKDAFDARYQLEDPRSTLRAAAQAAVREVVGRTEIDDVLSEGRGQVQSEAKVRLQEILDRYESGLDVKDVLLQEVAPPPAVREAFDDVIAAVQDGERKVQEAEGYRNEVLPRAEAESIELERSAEAYRDAKVSEASGEAARFSALLAEYKKAPEVTRDRLYLEAMEDVLPRVQKLIIEPGTGAVLPYFPPTAPGPGLRAESTR